MTNNFKRLVLDNNPNYQKQVQGFLSISDYDADLFTQCCEEICRQDRLKNINIFDYMPVNILQES